MGIHVFLMWPETCQKSLEEIELLFDGTVPAWRSASIKPESRFDEEVEELRRGSTVKSETKLNENDGAHLEREDTLV
jgi:hypothetical protein